jgi:uncharacterized membrane protein
MSAFIPFALVLVLFGAMEILTRLGIDTPGSRTPRARMRLALAAMFVFTGSAHFFATDAFAQSIPEFLPLRREAILISGLAQFAGAIGLLIPRLHHLAGIGLALMLLAVFPANINVALNNLQIEMFPREAAVQWARLLLQPIFIALVLWAGGDDAKSPRRELAAAQA